MYVSAKPQLLQTASGKKLLIFTTDMGDRTTGNHTAVVYSIYNERGWSIPKLIDDDGTADFDAVAAVDGENVYVTWINAKRTFTPEEAEAEDFMTKLAAETEVHAAKITLNGNTGTRRVIIRTNNSLQPVSSNNHFFKIRFFATGDYSEKSCAIYCLEQQ